MKSLNEKKIVESWLQNSKPWIKAIHNNEIESRIQTTNNAIIDTILERKPKKVLDVGCGEGWLVRELINSGINAQGIDIVPELVEAAKSKGGGKFQVLSYEELSKDFIKEKFDVVICNFSLLGNESVIKVFQSIKDLLNTNGYFIVQTIHPVSGCGDEEYKDGWRTGSWKGFSEEFSNPAPWYFRTMDTWKLLFKDNNMSLCEIIEPLNQVTETFASIIFVGKLNNK